MENQQQIAEKTPKPKSERILQKHSDIIQAAIKLFATQDYHTVLMDEVANVAGVGKGTLYRYFKDKEALFVACVEDAFDETIDFIHATKHDETMPYRERLRTVVLKLVEFYSTNGHFFRVMHHEKAFRAADGSSSIQAKWDKLRRIVSNLVEGGKQAGEFGNVDGAVVTAAVLGIVRALVNHMGGQPSQEIARSAAKIILEGIDAH